MSAPSKIVLSPYRHLSECAIECPEDCPALMWAKEHGLVKTDKPKVKMLAMLRFLWRRSESGESREEQGIQAVHAAR